MTEPREYKVFQIEHGTVIDHIPHWGAYKVLELLGLRGTDTLVTVGFGLGSGKLGRKDLLKVEKRELTQDEINRIAIVAPQATINLIRDSQGVEKLSVRLPDRFQGLVRCSNLGCITNGGEPAPPCFDTLEREPVTLRCHYCRHITRGPDLEML